MRLLCLSFAAASLFSVIACGGALQPEPSLEEGSDDNENAKTTLSAPAALPSMSPYGSWELAALENQQRKGQTTRTFGHLFLEMRDDGNVIARRCTKPYHEAAKASVRCSDSSAYDCVYGSVRWDGASWRLDLPALRASAKESRGEITAETSDTIVIRHILPGYDSGHFVRIAHDSPTASCAGP